VRGAHRLLPQDLGEPMRKIRLRRIMKYLKSTREEVAKTLEDFVEGRGGKWDWDDFLSLPIEDPQLDQIRGRCDGLSNEFPATTKGNYCGPEGIKVIRDYIRELRS
jgi:hypothetical protein